MKKILLPGCSFTRPIPPGWKCRIELMLRFNFMERAFQCRNVCQKYVYILIMLHVSKLVLIFVDNYIIVINIILQLNILQLAVSYKFQVYDNVYDNEVQVYDNEVTVQVHLKLHQNLTTSSIWHLHPSRIGAKNDPKSAVMINWIDVTIISNTLTWKYLAMWEDHKFPSTFHSEWSWRIYSKVLNYFLLLNCHLHLSHVRNQ